MMFIRQNPELKALACTLRYRTTPQEKLLWNSYLKHHRLQFYRQYVIDDYIVDFFCRKARLVIEIDGMQHYTVPGMKYDEKRSKCIEQYGILIVRFTNADVTRNLENVCQYIENLIQSRISSDADSSKKSR